MAGTILRLDWKFNRIWYKKKPVRRQSTLVLSFYSYNEFSSFCIDEYVKLLRKLEFQLLLYSLNALQKYQIVNNKRIIGANCNYPSHSALINSGETLLLYSINHSSCLFICLQIRVQYICQVCHQSYTYHRVRLLSPRHCRYAFRMLSYVPPLPNLRDWAPNPPGTRHFISMYPLFEWQPKANTHSS